MDGSTRDSLTGAAFAPMALRCGNAPSGAAAKQWLAEREAELLPVPYFHVVFTLPGPIADYRLPEQGRDLRSAVQGSGRGHPHDRGRSQAHASGAFLISDLAPLRRPSSPGLVMAGVPPPSDDNGRGALGPGVAQTPPGAFCLSTAILIWEGARWLCASFRLFVARREAGSGKSSPRYGRQKPSLPTRLRPSTTPKRPQHDTPRCRHQTPRRKQIRYRVSCLVTFWQIGQEL